MRSAVDVLRCLHAELVRSLTLRTVVTATFSAIVVIVLTFLITLLDARPVAPPTWVEYVTGTMTPFVFLLFPISAAMLGAHIASIEANAGGWKLIYALETPRSAVLLAKLIFVQALTLLSILIAAFGSLIAGYLGTLMQSDVTFSTSGDVLAIFGLCFSIWIAGLFMTTFHVWLGLWLRSSSLATGAGVAGLFLSFIGMAQGIAEVRYSPWFLPMHVLSGEDSAFSDAGPLSFWEVAITSTLGAVFVAIIGGYLHIKRDVR